MFEVIVGKGKELRMTPTDAAVVIIKQSVSPVFLWGGVRVSEAPILSIVEVYQEGWSGIVIRVGN